jgi:hypothetical protein
MKYQLVVQLNEFFFDEKNFVENLENLLEVSLTDAEIDGHDVGNGELNIFIHTNDPTNTLEETKVVLENQDIDLEAVKVGYRDFSSNIYVPIWPKDLEEFKVT